MLLLTHIELLNELVKCYKFDQFYIDCASFNSLVSILKANNIFCRFSYCDLEEYARSIPSVASIEETRIVFNPTKHWVNVLYHFAKLYETRGVNEILKGHIKNKHEDIIG